MSSHWEIEQGLSSSLLRCDGQIIYEGRWGDCHRSMLKRAEEDDVVTPGPAMKRIPAGQYRSRHNDLAKTCGVPGLIVAGPEEGVL